MIQLRPEREQDKLFIESVYYSTREKDLSETNWTPLQKQAFCIMQSIAQLSEYKKKYPGAEFCIIVYNKKEVGRFYTWQNENEIRLIDITILPAFRGRGIGTYLLHELIKRSVALKKKLSLHVLAGNRAQNLYAKLGFDLVKNKGDYNYMERDYTL